MDRLVHQRIHSGVVDWRARHKGMGLRRPRRGREGRMERRAVVVNRISVLSRGHECLSIGGRVNGVHCLETWGMRRMVRK